MSKVKVTTPHAAVIVWNYRDRVSGDKGVTLGANDVEPAIISTVSLISIATSKEKSAPHGQFELVLAPTKNWVAALTPGSWLCILMSQNKIQEADLKNVNTSQIKMLGRIDSVRAVVNVEPNGARQTVYRVSGPDWGQVFNTNVYLDPLARDLNKSDISTAMRFIYEKQVLTLKTNGIPSSRKNIEALLDIWGSKINPLSSVEKTTGVLLNPAVRYTFPKEVCDFLGLGSGEKAVAIKEAVVLKTGNLIGVDKYNNNLIDSLGVIQPASIFGNNNFWQLLNDNCNPLLNEVICDMDMVGKNKINLTLINRIKPFVFRDNYKGKDSVAKIESKFKNVKTINIDENTVQQVDAGTNWRDKYNFIEIQVDQSFLPDNRSADLKSKMQEFDPLAIQREGFRPLFAYAKYFPPKSNNVEIDEQNMFKWKYLLRQWYFDTHRMLNGNITFTGMDEYIRVGDNIMFKAKLIGNTSNINSGALKNPDDAYILAHVESINHSFNVSTNGARSFNTTVSFVRGIIVNKDKVVLDEGTLDLDATKMTPKEEKNTNTVSTSTVQDPDTKKLKGK